MKHQKNLVEELAAHYATIVKHAPSLDIDRVFMGVKSSVNKSLKLSPDERIQMMDFYDQVADKTKQLLGR